MNELNLYIPEVLKLLLENKNNPQELQKIKAKSKGNTLKTFAQIMNDTDAVSILDEKTIKKLDKLPFKAPYGTYDMMWSNLYVETKRILNFFNGTMNVSIAEKMYIQLREILHDDEFSILRNLLLDKPLVKGFTKEFALELYPELKG